jgi:lysophospholipase L1-like esterase
MNPTFWIAATLLSVGLVVQASATDVGGPPLLRRAVKVEQQGELPTGVSSDAGAVLANETEAARCTVRLEFDLNSVFQDVTPLARLKVDDIARVKAKRPGQAISKGHGVLHAFAGEGNQRRLVGSTPMKTSSLATPYVIDLTDIVNEVLAKSSGEKSLRFELVLDGTPAPFEIFTLSEHKNPPVLEIASSNRWTDDWQRRIAPITSGEIVYRESCLPLTATPNAEVPLKLLYPAGHIVGIIDNSTGKRLMEGRDWILRDGTLVLPVGSHAPIQIEKDFFTVTKPGSDGKVTATPSAIRLVEGTWYHERQIEVSYEPAKRDLAFAPPIDTIDALPRLKKRLAAKQPVRLVLFGDSISIGGNASKFQSAWSYQPCFGELVARQLHKHYRAPIEFMNHSRGGATSGYGVEQADSQVAWFKPDLVIVAYGMNDRTDDRRSKYRENLEQIIDIIRKRSPETEFLLVTSMLNNPVQPPGLEPILFLRGEALSISRPGLAHADVAIAHQAMLERKNYLDLSGNGINHPNDFLHRVYAQRILEVLTPAKN